MGSLQSFLQACGRGLRASPGKEFLTIQDHGGNYWRQGSVNEDRQWQLTDTSYFLAARREDQFRSKEKDEPARCPECSRIIYGPKCPVQYGGCGWERQPGVLKSRPVVQVDGSLVEIEGDIFKPRRVYQQPNAAQAWESMYWRSRSKRGARTFRAAFALFASENYWQWPSLDLPFMPKDPEDIYRMVADVPMEYLIPKPAGVEPVFDDSVLLFS